MGGLMPRKCPACSQDMHVCVLRCPACHTEVQGEYPLGRFAQLNGEQMQFLETFIRCRGSLKDVGAAQGISYPTARNRLDGLVRALGFEHGTSEREHRLEILTRLKDGQITPDEALNLLQQGGNTGE